MGWGLFGELAPDGPVAPPGAIDPAVDHVTGDEGEHGGVPTNRAPLKSTVPPENGTESKLRVPPENSAMVQGALSLV
jgi:hypothetical protein